MNWTGGALPRSRNGNAKAALTSIQKKHFAKVRSKILNGPQSSPNLDFSGLDHAGGIDGPPKKRSCHPSSRHSKSSSQTRLESYEHIAPLAHRLSSIRPRHDSLNIRRTKPTDSRRRHKHETARKSPSLSFSRITETHNQPYASHGKDIIRDPHVPSSNVVAQDSFESSRQDLLRKRDWVGLANSKPAKIQFIDAKDRHLIGKRRRLEGTDGGNVQHKKPRSNAMQYHRQESSSIGNISVRIGESSHGHQHPKTPPLPDGSVADSVDEMLLENDCPSERSIQSHNKGKSQTHQSLNISPLRSTQTIPFAGREDAGSAQTSWAGFSPLSNSNVMLAHGNPAREINDTGASDTFPAQGEIRKWPEVISPAQDRANTSKSLEQKAWMDVPGLPLIFEGTPQKPIDISSDSSSEIYSATPSNSQITLEKMSPVIDKRFDLQRDENFQEQKLELTRPQTNDISTLPATSVKETLLEPTEKQTRQSYPGASDIMPQPRNIIPAQLHDARGVLTAKVPELMDNLPAVSEASKRLEKLAKDALPPAQGDTSGPSLADEELIWRRFVFSDSNSYADEKEPEKPPKRTGPASKESSLIATLSESPRRSSLSVQASSTSVAAHRLGSTDANRDPLQTEAAATLSYTDSDMSFSSRQAEASLPASDEISQHAAISSVIAHASASSSPSRSHQLATSPSTDELATTPQQPTFYFRKPSRYIGAQLNGSVAVHLGQRQKERNSQGPTAAFARNSSRKVGTKPGEEEEEASEDEIIET